MPLLFLMPLALLAGQQSSTQPRFQLETPLPAIPGVMIDSYGTGNGIAQQVARAKGLQARIMWIDATANIERYNTREKIESLVKKIKEVGFNTIVLDIKPISGQTIYKSQYAPKLTDWRGQHLPPDFDPVPFFVKDCRAHGLSIFASLNAFSEGHRIFHVGPGYEKEDLQTVLYETKAVLKIGTSKFPLSKVAGKLSDEELSVSSQFPKTAQSAIQVNRAGFITDITASNPKPLAGSYWISGNGAAAKFLQTNARLGAKVSSDTEPLFVPSSQRPEQQIPLMMNPNNPEVQQYAINIVKEVVGNYDLDGIIYDDRLRYGGMNADFSPLTRAKFESYVKHPVRWPDDVFKYKLNLPSLSKGIQPGPLYETWINWRALQMHNYVAKVRATIKSIRPNAQLGIYAGSWYGEYPSLGHNYASEKTNAGFWFLTPGYAKTGTAALPDFLISGCYYPTATIYEAMSNGTNIGGTVEAAASLVNRLVRDETWNYAGIALSDFKDNPTGLGNALQAACASCQGVMVFDLSHDIEPMWPVFATAFRQPKIAPHSSPRFIAEVKKLRSIHDKSGAKDTPVIITTGTSGTGQ